MIKALLLAMPNNSPMISALSRTPNLGIASIAGNVDPAVCEVKVADLLVVEAGVEDRVLDLVRRHSPDLVGLSCMSSDYHSGLKLAELLKNHDKNIAIAMGGHHPTMMYEEISSSPDSQFIDFIVRGEGEATFNELVTAMDSGKGYSKIAGLSYKTNGVFCHNSPRDLLSLDTVQLPNRDARLITEGFRSFGVKADAIETSRGCTYNCKFCSINRMYGRTFRKYEISRVIADIKNAHRHGAKWLMFTDENVTLDLPRLEMLCDEIIAAKLNSIHYFLQASVKGIAHSEKLVKKMADAGMKVIFIGIESPSKTDLDFLGKRTSSPEDARKAAKYLRDNNIISLGGFIVGNPDDDKESLWSTFKMAWDLKIDAPGFGILIPNVKTEIRDELMAEGLIANVDDFSKYDNSIANIRTRYLAPEEIERTVQEMYRAYHGNPDYFRFNLVRRIYPAYFWKLAVKAIPSYALGLAMEWLWKRGKERSLRNGVENPPKSLGRPR